MTDQVDRDSSIPLYEQIKQIVRLQILSGEYAFGDRLPTEEEYCELFQVSTITVKRALNDLARAGLVSRRQGSGTIVIRKPVGENFKVVAGFFEIARRAGRKPVSTILQVRRVETTENLLNSFKIPTPTDIGFMSFQRLMSIDGRPSALLTAYVLEDLGSRMLGYDLKNRSFYQLYGEILGKKVTRSENILTPLNISPDAARHLEAPPGSAHMHIRSVSYIESGQVVEMSVGIFSGDNFQWKADSYEVRAADPGGILDQDYGNI